MAETTQPAGHEAETFDPGAHIMHHILDSKEVEIPFKTEAVQLWGGEGWVFGPVDMSVTRSVVMMWIVAAILIVVFRLAARKAKEPVPRGLRNALEVLVLYIRDEVARKTIPHHADRFVPYLLTIFFFILGCNLFGLVPGMSTATGSISVTAALAILSFLVWQFAGMREYGVGKHFANLLPGGIPWWVKPILLPVEILGMFTKPFALCVRLFANMTAGHVVILSLFAIIFLMKSAWWAGMSVPFALFIYVLEILVAFLQAYIFTMLTSLFIGMSVHAAH